MNGLDQPTIYAAGDSSLSWVAVPPSGGTTLGGTLQMPGPVRAVAWDESSNIIHVLGRTADGSSDTVYVVEPHGNAVFADARLPFPTVAMALDTQPDRPAQDRQQLLALDAAGQLAVVDIGNHAYAWRIMGVIAGALLLGCLYLLVRMLFRRRTVALLTAGARAGRRDVLRPVADRHERHVRGPLHRGRLHAVRAHLPGAVAEPVGRGPGHPAPSASCSAWPWPRSGWAPMPSAASSCSCCCARRWGACWPWRPWSA